MSPSVFDRLDRIRGVLWTWKDEAGPLGKVPGSRDAGVIAQEVETVFPELIVTTAEGYKSVNYTGLVGVVIEAVKELKAKNDALEKRVAELEHAKSDALEKRVAELEHALAKPGG